MTLIEVLVSSLVLGFGVVALAELFTTSVRTDADGRARDVATQLALLRVEQLATIPVDRLPACGPVGTCRLDRANYAPARAATPDLACTQIVDDERIPDDTTSLATGKYRIDTAIFTPTGATQQAEARIALISVCWTDIRGVVQQVQAERLMVPEL